MASFRFFLHWIAFQANNNVWSAPAGSALTLVSHRSHNARTANCHIRAKGERNGVQRKTKVIFGKTMIWALELLRLVKRHISGWSDIVQWRNQACSYSHYRVTLVWRHYSQSVSQHKNVLNKKFLKFHNNLMQQCRVDLKTFYLFIKTLQHKCWRSVGHQVLQPTKDVKLGQYVWKFLGLAMPHQYSQSVRQ